MAADRRHCAGTDRSCVSCLCPANMLLLERVAPEWRNGRRYGLKNRWGQPRTGSSPVSGTSTKPNAEECPPRLVISTANLTAKVLNRAFHPPFDLRFLRGTVC